MVLVLETIPLTDLGMVLRRALSRRRRGRPVRLGNGRILETPRHQSWPRSAASTTRRAWRRRTSPMLLLLDLETGRRLFSRLYLHQRSLCLMMALQQAAPLVLMQVIQLLRALAIAMRSVARLA